MNACRVVRREETTIIELNDEEIAELILGALGVEGGDVHFDVSCNGNLRGATVTKKIISTEENP